MPFTIDGVTTYPYEDADGFDFAPFYEKLRSGVVPSTSGIGIEKYTSYFEPAFADGDDILYVHFSRAMSGSFEAMDAAVEALQAKYPARRFYTVDTRMITIGSLAIARDVAKLVKAGKTADEVLEWAKTEIDHYAVYFFADDLRFFRHSGRVSGLAGIMGTLLGVRPIINMNAEGKMGAVGKEKGRVRALERLISYMDELGNDIGSHEIIVGHADAAELANELVEMIRAEYGDVDIDVVNVNPTIGSHCGPDSVGVCFRSVRR
jgi:DegV family protein with EDD domain